MRKLFTKDELNCLDFQQNLPASHITNEGSYNEENIHVDIRDSHITRAQLQFLKIAVKTTP